MKRMPLRIHRRAQIHPAEAYSWHQQQRAGLGLEFLNEVEACLDRICENPGMFPVYREGIRRAATHGFPCLVFYAVGADEIVVIAVFHASRNPRRRP